MLKKIVLGTALIGIAFGSLFSQKTKAIEQGSYLIKDFNSKQYLHTRSASKNIREDGTFSKSQVALTSDFTLESGGNKFWESFDKFPRQVADVNGDGRADIVGFAKNNVRVSL